MKFEKLMVEPKVGHIVVRGQGLYLCIGFEECSIKLYPLFIHFPDYFTVVSMYEENKAYYDKVIRNAVKFLLTTTLASNLIFTQEVVDIDILKRKTKRMAVLNPDTLYATQEEIALWYTKCRLAHSDLPNLHYDLEKYLYEKRQDSIQCSLVGNNVLQQLGIYKTSDLKCIVYLGYHKDLNTYFYWHTKINNLSSDVFFKRAKLKDNATFDTCSITQCEHIGDMLDTKELRDYLLDRGLSLCNIVR